MKLSVHLVTFNGAKYLPYLFRSLQEQTYKDWELVIWENGSEDNSMELISQLKAEMAVPVTVHISDKNLGFAGGHNTLFASADAEFVMLLNQDLYLDADCIGKVMQCMQSHPEAAVVSPRLMKWHFDKVEDGACEESFSPIIDSLGLVVSKSLRASELFSGLQWGKESSHPGIQKIVQDTDSKVFGVSGTAPLFRMSAIRAVQFSDNEVFDALYHSYKEDVDLAFRLNQVGYEAYVCLIAAAYHDRSAVGLMDAGMKALHSNKKQQTSYIKYHSYKNHLMTVYKNFWLKYYYTYIPRVVLFELVKFGYYLVSDRKVLGGLGYMWKHRKEMKKKKQYIKSKRVESKTAAILTEV